MSPTELKAHVLSLLTLAEEAAHNARVALVEADVQAATAQRPQIVLAGRINGNGDPNHSAAQAAAKLGALYHDQVRRLIGVAQAIDAAYNKREQEPQAEGEGAQTP